uniref:Transforming acidic coiled-coil-containing protein 3 n=1 Tax=Phallusia mammillata TaxID=59560 RepID=A0A6F9DUU1_9ASCI|nr:transforming acidic coiled-coil-containing protein 3 [Phallusia mammillata]
MNSDDLLAFSPNVGPSSILKTVCDNENLMVHQTPIHKNLKVSFQTPARTPLGTVLSQQQSTVELLRTKQVAKKGPTQDWHVLRDLDEELKWKERIEVVTKKDHEDYVECAKGFIEDVITNVVQSKLKESSAVDLKNNNSMQSKKVQMDKNANIEIKLEGIPEIPDALDKENQEPSTIKQTPKLKKVKLKRPGKSTSNGSENTNQQEDKCSLPSSSGGYNLDNLDDANFNPFVTSKCMPNSPTRPSTSSSTFSTKETDESIPHFDLSSANPIEGSFCNSSMDDIMSSMCGSDLKQLNSRSEIKPLNTLLMQSPNELSLCNLDDTAANADSTISKNHDQTITEEKKEPSQESSSQPELALNQDLDETLKEEETKDQQVITNEMEFVSAESLMQGGFDFDLDYLANKGDGVVVPDLHKHSLYLKFDPLVTQESRLSRLSTLIGRKSDIIDLCGRVSLARKNRPLPPMQEIVDHKPTPDLLCDSPTKFRKEMDESHSSDGRSSVLSDTDSNEEIIEVLRYSETEMRRLIDECKEPLEAKISESSTYIEKLQTDNEKLLEILKDFDETTSNIVVNQEIEEKKNKAAIIELETEKEELKSHLESIEKAYMDLLKRMEHMKTSLTTNKNSIVTYKKAIEDLKSNLQTSQKRYKALKETMEEREQKLIDQRKKKEQEMQSQITGLTARCKYLENQTKSLKSQVEQTTNENQELTKICDELIEQQTCKT